MTSQDWADQFLFEMIKTTSREISLIPKSAEFIFTQEVTIHPEQE